MKEKYLALWRQTLHRVNPFTAEICLTKILTGSMLLQIRSVIAKEMIQDLSDVAEENSALMRETIQLSFSLNIDNVTSHPVDNADTVDPKP